MTKIIGFQSPDLDVRGTTTALLDYAKYNESILGNKSIVFLNAAGKIDDSVYDYLYRTFKFYFFNGKEHLEELLQKNKVDVLYTIKFGKSHNSFTSDKVKTVVHCVFDMSDPHGDVYAGVSQALAKRFGKKTFVPHMIGLKPVSKHINFRNEFGIPQDHVVIGRYGGLDTFNLSFVYDVIREVCIRRSDIWFLLNNVEQRFKHPRVIYIDQFYGDMLKSKFINTCDAYLEAGNLGHSFGLAIGEFSVHNKPIIAYNLQVLNTAHFDILKDNALYYKTPVELKNLLLEFKRADDKDWNNYREYEPDKVMKIFEEVFLG